jgi:hypothetical protein
MYGIVDIWTEYTQIKNNKINKKNIILPTIADSTIITAKKL